MLLIVLVGTYFVRGRHCVGPWGWQPVEQVSVLKLLMREKNTSAVNRDPGNWNTTARFEKGSSYLVCGSR